MFILYVYIIIDENKWVGGNSKSSIVYKGWRDEMGGCEERLCRDRGREKKVGDLVLI